MHVLQTPRQRFRARVAPSRTDKVQEDECISDVFATSINPPTSCLTPTATAEVFVYLKGQRIFTIVRIDTISEFRFQFSLLAAYHALSRTVRQAAACLQCLHDLSIVPQLTHGSVRTRTMYVPDVRILRDVQRVASSAKGDRGLDSRGVLIIGFAIFDELQKRATQLDVSLRALDKTSRKEFYKRGSW